MLSIFFPTFVAEKTRDFLSCIFSYIILKKVHYFNTYFAWVGLTANSTHIYTEWMRWRAYVYNKKMGIKNTKWFSISAAYTYLFFFFLYFYSFQSVITTMLTCIVLFIWSHDEKSVTILAPSWSHSLRFLKVNICYFNSLGGEIRK